MLEFSSIWGNVVYNKKNLEKLILMITNWPNDAKVGCNAPSNLVELIDLKLDLKHELNEFEGSFEWDELKDD